MISKCSLFHARTLLGKTFQYLFLLCVCALLMLPGWSYGQVCGVTHYQTVILTSDKSISNSSISGTGANRLLPVPGSTTTPQYVIIRGSGRILFDASYSFAPGSVIIFEYDDLSLTGGFVVKNSKTLSILSSATNPTTLRGCAHLWHGITVENLSTLILQPYCTIQDAITAVTLKSYSILNAQQTTFKANYTGIRVEPTGTAHSVRVTTTLNGNTFTGADALLETVTVGGGSHTYPYYGIDALGAINLIVDASATPSLPNVFTDFARTVDEGSAAGIHAEASTLTVKNAEFHNIGRLESNPSGPSSAYGILMHNDEASVTSKLTLTGRGQESSPATFDDVYYGIEVENINLDVRNARFTDGTVHINILPALSLLNHDIIGNAFLDYLQNGINAAGALPTAHFNVNLNDFRQANDIGQANFANSGGYFRTNGTPVTGLKIISNTFVNDVSAYGMNGFVVSGGQSANLEANNFTYNAGEQGGGISLVGTYLNSARGNHFTGENGNTTNNGFSATDAKQSAVTCNTFAHLNMGASFSGLACDGTALTENAFGTNTTCLLLQYLTTIGVQKHRLNTWPSSSSGQEDAQFDAVPGEMGYSDMIAASRFEIQTAETSTSVFWANPRIPGGDNWFTWVPGTTPATQCGTGPVPPGNGSEGLTPKDSTVIAGTHPVYAGFDATLWDAKLSLYRSLYEKPALRPTGSGAATFYSTNASTPYALLGMALSKYDQIMSPDSVTKAQVEQLYSYAYTAQHSIDQVDSVFKVNPTPSDSTTLRTTRTTQTTIRDSVNTLLVEKDFYFDTLRLSQLAALQTTIAAISVSESYEANLKTVLGILVTATRSDSLWHWTAIQKTKLDSIAGLCRLSGGHGVLLARIMTGSNAGNLDACTIAYRRTPSAINSPEEWTVIPNPTTGMLRISLPTVISSGTLELYDQQGRKAVQRRITEESSFDWDLSALNNGLYYLRLTGSTQTFSVQKILLQH